MANKATWLCILGLASFAVGGCATTTNRFKQIYPGMTRAEVAQMMEAGPSRADNFENGYSAWYYGEDRCLLLQNDQVVSKQVTEQRTTVATPLGGLSEKVKANCVPPGMESQGNRRIQIHTPAGSFDVPDSTKR